MGQLSKSNKTSSQETAEHQEVLPVAELVQELDNVTVGPRVINFTNGGLNQQNYRPTAARPETVVDMPMIVMVRRVRRNEMAAFNAVIISPESSIGNPYTTSLSDYLMRQQSRDLPFFSPSHQMHYRTNGHAFGFTFLTSNSRYQSMRNMYLNAADFILVFATPETLAAQINDVSNHLLEDFQLLFVQPTINNELNLVESTGEDIDTTVSNPLENLCLPSSHLDNFLTHLAVDRQPLAYISTANASAPMAEEDTKGMSKKF